MLKFIVKLHPEIAIKSKSVRKRFTKVLEKNIKMLLVRVDENVKVKNNWDNISVTSELSDEKTRLGLIDHLKRTPGIVQFIEVQETQFDTLDDIYQQTIALVEPLIKGKTFCVRVKRQGKHELLQATWSVMLVAV